MAELDDDDNNGDEEQPKRSGSKKKLLLFVLLGLVLIAVSVGGTLTALTLFGKTGSDEEAEVAEEAAPPPPQPAIYYPLKPPIMVDFAVRGRQRYLQAEITVMTRDSSVISTIELHQPMIRNSLVLLIGGQVFAELQTAEGKELLRQQCLQEIQRLLQQEIGKPGIEQVLFTSFVIQ